MAVALIKTATGAGFGLTYVALVVITGRLMPTHLQNTGQALMQTAGTGIAPIVAAALGGVVYRHLGAPFLFAGTAASTGLGAVIVWETLSAEAFSRGGSGRANRR